MHAWLVFGTKSICPDGVDGTDFLTLGYTSEMLKKANNFPLKDVRLGIDRKCMAN
jgi:hypothetical protein